jgi:hypothetical protein
MAVPIKYAVIPSLVPDARLVRALEAKLPLQPLPLEDICRLLAYSETRRPMDCDVLRALIDLEERGLARRVRRKGWARDNQLFGKEKPGE